MDKPWRILFTEHLLRSRGLHYMGSESELEAHVEQHYPWVTKEAAKMAKLVEDKLAHDAVFKTAKPS